MPDEAGRSGREPGGTAADGEPRAARGGFAGPPADGGLSIDRLAQAFAAMMGAPQPALPADVVEVDTSPDLDAPERDEEAARVSPLAILEALLFVGLPGGRPLGSRLVASLMRGVQPAEVDELARELARRCRADNCPYEVVARDDGWVMRLHVDYARFGSVLESRARMVRLDGESLEMLALVAWHQPVPRDRLVELGCDARPATLRQLVRRGLLELRRPDEGEPTYHTTPRFLEVFGLQSLDDLPNPADPPA